MNELIKFALFALVLVGLSPWPPHTQAKDDDCMTNAQITQKVEGVMNEIITSVAKQRGRSVEQLKKLPEASLVRDQFEYTLRATVINLNKYCGY